MLKRLSNISNFRAPDEVIGPGIRSRLRDGHVPVPKAFLRRWFIIPKNKWLNIYLHQFIRDDEDRALHDHPWWNLSWILSGEYIEHTIAAGGTHQRWLYKAGDMKFRPPWAAHRIELVEKYDPITGWEKWPVWSLFITGPVQRKWGFHCPGEWRSSDDFASKGGCHD